MIERRKFLTITAVTTLATLLHPTGNVVLAGGRENDKPKERKTSGPPVEPEVETEEIDLLHPCKKTSQSWIGKASYYTRAGCMGCSGDLRMANGEILDDSRLTLAFMRAPLNRNVLIENLDNGLSVVARITDRGGLIPLNITGSPIFLWLPKTPLI